MIVGRFELQGQISMLRRELEQRTRERDELARKLDAACNREAWLVSLHGDNGPVMYRDPDQIPLLEDAKEAMDGLA